jgi:hypothetical protein
LREPLKQIRDLQSQALLFLLSPQSNVSELHSKIAVTAHPKLPRCPYEINIATLSPKLHHLPNQLLFHTTNTVAAQYQQLRELIQAMEIRAQSKSDGKFRHQLDAVSYSKFIEGIEGYKDGSSMAARQ